MLKATFSKLSIELEQLKSEERATIAKIIDEARELGDLKENAEYHAAKEKQGLMEARIQELQGLTSCAHIIDPALLAHERISFGSTVTLTDQDTDEELCYTLVGVQESNPSRGLISIESPVAKALLGKQEGDEAEIILPAGRKSYDIDEVKYVPIEC